MDSQRTVDHLRDEANARKDTTLGDLLDTAAEELDEAEDTIDAKAHSIAVLQEEAEQLKNTIDRLKHERDHFKNGFERTVEKNLEVIEQRDELSAEIARIKKAMQEVAFSVGKATPLQPTSSARPGGHL